MNTAVQSEVWAFIDLKHNAVPFVGDKQYVEQRLDAVVKGCESADKANQNSLALDDCAKFVWLVSSSEVSPEAMKEMVDKRTIPQEVRKKFL